MSALVIQADAGRLPLPDASVDLIVTSPPYFGLRSYQDNGAHYEGQVGAEPTPARFLNALWDCTAEMIRVLKPSGSMWVNLGDKYVSDNRGSSPDQRRGRAKYAPIGPSGFVGRETARQKSLIGLPWRYAIGCIDQLGLILRAEVIWSKPNGLPESVTDRVRRAHEQWFHFTKEPRYFSDVDEIREPFLDTSDHALNRWARREGHKYAKGVPGSTPHGMTSSNHSAGKLPGSVWEIQSEPLTVPDCLGIEHFAAFPTEFPRRIISAWSPSAGVVLDPFGGTGTTALCASVLGRIGISVDLSHDYSRLAQWRTQDSASRAKAMRVEKPPVQLDGQDQLFGDVA